MQSRNMPFMTRRIIAGPSAVANPECLESSFCRFVATSRPLCVASGKVAYYMNEATKNLKAARN